MEPHEPPPPPQPPPRYLGFRLIHEDAVAPTKSYPGSIGWDLSSVDSMCIPPRERRLFETGISIKLPAGTYGRLESKSGLALHEMLDVKAGKAMFDVHSNESFCE